LEKPLGYPNYEALVGETTGQSLSELMAQARHAATNGKGDDDWPAALEPDEVDWPEPALLGPDSPCSRLDREPRQRKGAFDSRSRLSLRAARRRDARRRICVRRRGSAD
jgi:hypothetical protein